MGYVPPHKRGAAATPAAPPASPSPAPGSRDFSSAGSMGRTYSSSKRSPIEPNFIAWEPSERIKALTPEQGAEIAQRLQVSVQTGEGQPPAPPPIESFQEMVRSSSWKCV